jgi:hypothetical protein
MKVRNRLTLGELIPLHYAEYTGTKWTVTRGAALAHCRSTWARDTTLQHSSAMWAGGVILAR